LIDDIQSSSNILAQKYRDHTKNNIMSMKCMLKVEKNTSKGVDMYQLQWTEIVARKNKIKYFGICFFQYKHVFFIIR